MRQLDLVGPLDGYNTLIGQSPPHNCTGYNLKDGVELGPPIRSQHVGLYDWLMGNNGRPSVSSLGHGPTNELDPRRRFKKRNCPAGPQPVQTERSPSDVTNRSTANVFCRTPASPSAIGKTK
ncbi:hypothetical protein GOBAR_AA23953 [Gossypium barbadense]|uniref:Uncharacterized protein n=1 Tax=Gossypium barbadense TaxID=3634 RepID=A0A2P5X042_GOSBA|nr:hypothetical protein GOBAR_AA23953 [Gossypium barbadense]